MCLSDRSGVCFVSTVLVLIGMSNLCIAQKKEAKSNELCYVCHFDMITEEITNIHLKRKIVCTDCHGISKHHMHDEMLMTKPDKLFGRAEVVGLCKHCHKKDPHKDMGAKIAAFIEKWKGKDRPNGRVINDESICTDCHGTHNIVKKLGKKDGEKEEAEWISAFNGENLDGWVQKGDGKWTVKRGRIVATPEPGGKGGTIWTREEFGDCLVAVTFKADWPIHAQILLRDDEKKDSPVIEIFASSKPVAYTGSVTVADKGLALANLNKDLVSYMSWNTLSARLEGGRVTVWLNGEEIGSVVGKWADKGRIGLGLSSEAGNKAELTVNEVQVQRLEK